MIFDAYLCKVKDAIKKDNYQIANNSRRKDNKKLFWDYIIDEKMAKEILLELTAYDFSEILQNEHRGYKNEFLYVFGKDVRLLERFGSDEKLVHLYIKFNRLDDGYVVVISLHEQKYPISYYFK
ncbi:hypothetical protein [Ligilactobacillus ruminis]|uniref:Uncharacterized protein n=1 Tax=Ligilactobacillus ruminis (strain ATCC 27782 / RF3) TaxID=1069534 RepID=G2SNL1_LIGR2|nr:hypothetical protein [Ligilactobacillus ruminis]AEN78174.1 conserved hypothetical protein [Ligilactobacillus ruminis ATCC 27782]